MFSQLFPIAASELNNQFLQLTEVLPQTAQSIENRLSPNLTTTEFQQLLNNYFSIQIQSADIKRRLVF